MNTTTCPTLHELNRFLERETIVEPLDSVIAQHVETCVHCQTQLDSLTRGPREWLLPDRQGVNDVTPPHLPGYRIEAMIGRGSFGIVWRAYDEKLRRIVAIKQLKRDHADGDTRQRFIREARAIAQIRHPNLVGIHDIHTPEDGSPPIMIMECVTGSTLRVTVENRVPPRRAAELAVGLIEGLAAAHAVGITHRDVKPENVLLDDSTNTPKLVDFGLARVSAFESRLTREGMLLGTPAYMAPEQVLEPLNVGTQADIYSAGATFYELLTGQAPFRGSVHSVLQDVIHNDPPPPRTIEPTIPLDLETVCTKAMAKEPSRRYATAREFADDLRRYLVGDPVLARPLSRWETVKRWSQRNPKLALLSGVVAALLFAVAVGSTIFALALLRERDRTATALATARENAEEARHAQSIAETNEAAAQTAQAIAADSYNVLFVEFQHEMRSRPGMTNLYQRIIKRCLEGYQRMAEAGEKSANLDRSTVTAIFRMGETQYELGQITEAKNSFLQSLQLAEQLRAAEPNNKNHELDIAQAQQALGRLAVRELNWPQAKRYLESSLQIRRTIAQSQPSDALSYNIGNLHKELGKVKLNLGQTTDARADIERSIDILERLQANDPTNPLYIRSVQGAHSELGDTYLFGNQPGLSIDHLEKALSEAQQLWTLEPYNLLALNDVGVGQAKLITAHLFIDDPKTARRYAQECHATSKELFVADSKRMLFRRGLSISQELLGHVALRQKRYDDAATHYTQALGIIDELIAEDATAVELAFNRIQIPIQLSIVEEHRQDYVQSKRWLNQSLEQTKKLAENPALQPTMTPIMKNIRKTVLAVTHIEAALKDRAVLNKYAEPTEGVLELLCGLNRVRAGRIDEALDLAKAAEARVPNDPIIFQNTVRIYCLAANDPTSTPARRKELTDLAIAKFTQSLRLGVAPTDFYLEPDLDSIRNDPRYEPLVRPHATN